MRSSSASRAAQLGYCGKFSRRPSLCAVSRATAVWSAAVLGPATARTVEPSPATCAQSLASAAAQRVFPVPGGPCIAGARCLTDARSACAWSS
eukprot:3222732-Pyramimonas_sp.AAC.2